MFTFFMMLVIVQNLRADAIGIEQINGFSSLEECEVISRQIKASVKKQDETVFVSTVCFKQEHEKEKP